MRYAEYILHYRKTVGDIRVEFYRGFNAGAPAFSVKEIGDVLQGLSLQIQGDQGDIDTPIVKTSLAISLINAPDLNDGNMNGAWDFFAQGTETEWMVQICREDDDLILWSGFVTPDSYSEEIKYRGSCSIVARDNIGQLQNYDFDMAGDADGMVNLASLVSTAWSKIANGMTLRWAADSMWLLTDLGTPARYTQMNVSAFKDKSWYEVLESALYAYGAVLRYAGNNTFIVCPLKWLPTLGETYDKVTWQEPLLLAGASLEYAPAVKQIEETASYDLQESKDIALVGADEYTGAVINTEFEGKDTFGATVKGQAPVWPLSKTMYEAGWSNPVSNAPLLLNAARYSVNDFAKTYLTSEMLFLTNTTGANEVVYTTSINAASFKVKLSFGSCFEFINSSLLGFAYASKVSKLKYGISVQQGNTTKFWSGSAWVNEQTKLEAEFGESNEVEIDCNLQSYTGAVTFRFHIYAVGRTSSISTQNAAYACLTSIEMIPIGATALRSVNRVITKYNEVNNLILQRVPKLAPAFDRTLYPSFIQNGIFEKVSGEIRPTPLWQVAYDFENDVEVYTQLAAGIHMQMLPYYTKPNRVINGTIVNRGLDYYNPRFFYDGREYILLSGSYNCISGHLEGAVLREFARYDDIWQGANIPEIKEESTNK